jgi:hypothetical protein
MAVGVGDPRAVDTSSRSPIALTSAAIAESYGDYRPASLHCPNAQPHSRIGAEPHRLLARLLK